MYSLLNKKPLALRKDGKSLYQSYCSSCHRVDGEGTGKVFPALNKNSLINQKEILIKIILNGDQAIPLASKNESGQEMPSFDFLDDDQVANILTYIRTSWNNDAGEIKAKEVKNIREKLK